MRCKQLAVVHTDIENFRSCFQARQHSRSTRKIDINGKPIAVFLFGFLFSVIDIVFFHFSDSKVGKIVQ
jgi:hypothetical protein